MLTFFDALEICLEKRLTFAAFRLPDKAGVTLVVQKTPGLQELEDISRMPLEGGFVIAPFAARNGAKTWLIRPDMLMRDRVTPEQLQSLESIPAQPDNGAAKDNLLETSKADFIAQIERTIHEIKSGRYEKVVLSRVKTVEGNYSSRLASIFIILCEMYENAFVYLFRINGHCWTGATPEPLICTKENEIVTVSLAGTRAAREANLDVSAWNHKERVEQQYVTTCIEDVLSEYHITDYRKKGPYVVRAGKLMHLRTDFTFSFDGVCSNLHNLIVALHPTSAVCGMPKENALRYIKEIENHHREYYAGFLGPVGLDGRLQLFVNLRCMKVCESQLVLYVGGGVTDESVAEEEWEETEIKAETLLSVVRQVK